MPPFGFVFSYLWEKDFFCVSVKSLMILQRAFAGCSFCKIFTMKERTKEGQLEGSIRTNAKLFPGSLFGWGRCTSEINGICSTYPSVLANFYLCVSLKISEK